MDIVDADPGVLTHCSRYWHYNEARYMGVYTLETSAPIFFLELCKRYHGVLFAL